MPRESKRAKRERAVEMCRRMGELYPAVESALDYHDPFTLVICVLLSAQTTDAAVNKVTPELFRRWPTAEAMAQADPAEIAEVIRTIGFFRAKSLHCVEASQMIVSDYGGEVPQTMEELTRLPGVGRKTANIVLNKGFGIVDGIAVDTHVYRISRRMRSWRCSMGAPSTSSGSTSAATPAAPSVPSARDARWWTCVRPRSRRTATPSRRANAAPPRRPPTSRTWHLTA